MTKPLIPTQRLRELLRYEPGTGVLYWRVKLSSKRQAGDVAGSITAHGRRSIGIERFNYAAHRLAWALYFGEWPRGVLDHINGDPLDNRIANLRECDGFTNMQNQRRAHANSGVGLLGVTRTKVGTFRAKLKVRGAYVNVGSFRTPEAAHAAYLEAKRQLHAGCTL